LGFNCSSPTNPNNDLWRKLTHFIALKCGNSTLNAAERQFEILMNCSSREQSSICVLMVCPAHHDTPSGYSSICVLMVWPAHHDTMSGYSSICVLMVCPAHHDTLSGYSSICVLMVCPAHHDPLFRFESIVSNVCCSGYNFIIHFSDE